MILIFIIFFSCFVSAQNLDNAIEEYQRGEIQKSIKTLEVLYQKNSSDEQVKNLLVKILVEVGMDESLKDAYTGAIDYFERAKKINPDDKSIIELCNVTKSLIKNKTGEEKQTDKTSKVSSPNSTSLKVSDMSKLLDIFSNLEKQQQSTKENINELLNKTKENDMLFTKEIVYNRKSVKRIIYLSIFAIIISVVFIGIFIYIIFSKIADRKDSLLIHYQNSLFKTLGVQNKQNALSTANKVPESNEMYKIKGIDVIEAEFNETNPVEKDIAVKLLSAFINDDSLKIREKAIRGIHKYDRVKTEKIIINLADSKNKKDNLIFIRVSDLLNLKKSIKYFNNYIENNDLDIRRETLRYLDKIDKKELSQNIIKKIEKIKSEEKWVIK